MKKLLKYFVLTCVILLFPIIAHATNPALSFSDIVSGPKTGLGDGLGSGAIVTIWGTSLGNSQGTSQVYFKDSLNNTYQAAHVYYWTNADGKSGGGPADLYTYHKMQEIAFSIPSSVADGAGKIYVTVSGVNSSELDFTIRSGKIYHVKVGGNNSTGDGSWGNPWASVDVDTSGAAGKVSTGDTVYVGDGVQEIGEYWGLRVLFSPKGTVDAPISVIAYPGADYLVQGGTNAFANHFWQNSGSNEYWNFAKIRTKSDSAGNAYIKGGRFVGNSLTDITCATGSSAAMGTAGRHGGMKFFGNYIYEWGCDTTSFLEHTTYFTNRYNGGNPTPAVEVGWNYLRDNKARGGMHWFDEGVCGDFSGTIKVHDNVVKNQTSGAFGISSLGTPNCISAPFEVYNNLFINSGQEPFAYDGVISLSSTTTTSHVKFYNNTIYGSAPTTTHILGVRWGGGTYWADFGGTFEWINNIVVDVYDVPFLLPLDGDKTPTAASNNIWYNGGNGNPTSPPSWDSGALTADPLFVNPSLGDFRLKEGSPAKDAGYKVSNVLLRDIFGVNRLQQGTAYDIGAYEYDTGVVADWLPPSAPSNLQLISQ